MQGLYLSFSLIKFILFLLYNLSQLTQLIDILFYLTLHFTFFLPPLLNLPHHLPYLLIFHFYLPHQRLIPHRYR